MKKKINLCTTEANLPDGTYKGKWSASTLVVKGEKSETTLKTKVAVKGINLPVDIIVRDKQVVDIESVIV